MSVMHSAIESSSSLDGPCVVHSVTKMRQVEHPQVVRAGHEKCVRRSRVKSSRGSLDAVRRVAGMQRTETGGP